MKINTQELTKAAYEDPDIVKGYIKAHAKHPHLSVIKTFREVPSQEKEFSMLVWPWTLCFYVRRAWLRSGCHRLLQIHDRAGKKLRKVVKPPRFIVMDMTEIEIDSSQAPSMVLG